MLQLRDYLSILNRKKWLIIGGTAAGLVLAGAISLFLPRIYQAELILQVGKILLPPQSQGGRQEVEFLEEPEATGEVVTSEEVLDQVREQLGLDIELPDFKDNLQVSTFMENVSPTRLGNPLVRITCQDRCPQTAVDILNSLARIIIEKQNRKYSDHLEAYRERITSLENLIAELEAVIAHQRQARIALQAEVKAAMGKIDDHDRRMAEFDTSQLSPLEVLYLFFYSSNQDRTISLFSDSLVTIDYNIAASLEKIGLFRDQISILNNLMLLCEQTEIRSRAVLPRKFIKPKIAFNIGLGGFLGLVLTVVIAFSGEERPD